MSTGGITIGDSDAYASTINWGLVRWSSLIVICVFEIYNFFVSASFAYWQLVLARLAVTFLPLALVASLYQASERFRVLLIDLANAANDFFLARGTWRPFKKFGHFQITFAALLCLLFYCLKQPTAFASSHSKRLAEILFVTDRSAHSEGAVDGVATTNFGFDAGVPQSISYGTATLLVQWADGFLPGRFPLGMQFRWTENLKRADRESAFQYAVGMDRDAFIAAVATGLQSAPAHDILMFVHGFRTTFSDAMSSASDLSFDLKYGGVLVAFSWPSGDAVTGYDHDYENASESIKDLSSLIELLANSHPSKINVIAHSMGSRVLGKAIDLIQERGHKLPHFKNIVFAAPDVDPNTFQNFSPAIRSSGERITIYVSAADVALWSSSRLHRGDRVGVLRRRYDGMDVIDTRGVDTSQVRKNGHSYLFDSVLVLSDLFTLIDSDRGPKRRPNLFLAPDGCWQFEHR